jgi:hypothetical protein
MKIQDLPLLPSINGNEKIPTGGFGNYATSINQIKDVVTLDLADDLALKADVSSVTALTEALTTTITNQAIKDTQQDQAIGAVGGGAKSYLTLASLTASTPPVVNTLAYVSNDATTANNGMYTYSGSAWIKSLYDPLTQALSADSVIVTERNSIIRKNPDDVVKFTDRRGFSWGGLTTKALTLQGWSVDTRSMDNRIVFKDRRGFIVQDIKPSAATATLTTTDLTKPMFGAVLCGFGLTAISIPSMLQDRAKQRINPTVQVSIGCTGVTTLKPYFSSGRDYLYVDTAQLGSTAELLLTDVSVPDKATKLSLTVATAPDGAGQTLTYLGLGDSIENRMGGLIVKQQLESRNYIVNCVGTMTGIGNQSHSSSAASGVAGEGREGWRITDWTHQTAAKTPVASGDEATYIANSQSGRLGKHPYLRVATGGDPAGDVRNGYILDFAWGWSRFGVTTPTDICVTLGANDMLAYTGATLSGLITTELDLLLRRLRVAVPTARIVVAMPNTGTSQQFDDLWPIRDFVAIRATMGVVNTLNDAKIKLCPAWAFEPAIVGQTFSTTISTDTLSGAVIGTLGDQIHPQNAARAALHTAKAAYVACLAKELI